MSLKVAEVHELRQLQDGLHVHACGEEEESAQRVGNISAARLRIPMAKNTQREIHRELREPAGAHGILTSNVGLAGP